MNEQQIKVCLRAQEQAHLLFQEESAIQHLVKCIFEDDGMQP